MGGSLAILLGVDGERRSIVVPYTIGRLNARAAPLARVMRHRGKSSGSAVAWIWKGWCRFARVRAGTVIDHNNLLGDSIFVEFAPVRFLPPAVLRGIHAGPAGVGCHARWRRGRRGDSRRLCIGEGCSGGRRNRVGVGICETSAGGSCRGGI